MNDFIVCPECGEKIYVKNSKILATPFFGYITCPECKKSLTDFQGFSKAYRIIWTVIIPAVMILSVFLMCRSGLAEWLPVTVPCILTVLAVGVLAAYEIIRKRRIKKARNGLLPFISGVCRGKFVSYAKETEITQKEIDGINAYIIEQDNFLAKAISKRRRYDDPYSKVVLLLPRTDMTVKLSGENASNLKWIKLYDIYRVNNEDIFLQLSNYSINENNDISLEFKRVNDTKDRSGSFELFTLEGGYIGKVMTEK
ncbi:MAG: hypothetical protein K2N72_03695 [Oscillospiraceae bacterium]|nr:hypothetical protein [Oscillospiraceae bacterium]